MKRALVAAFCAALLAPGFAGAQDGPPPAPPTDAEKPAPPAKAGPSKATLAVLPFTFNDVVRERWDGFARDVLREFETSTLTNKLITELVNTRKFDVLERAKLDKLVEEHKLGASGAVDPTAAAKAGQLLGADYFLTGQISIFTVTQRFTEVPYTQKHKRTVTAEIVVDMRIIDTRTSKIVAAEKGEARFEDSTILDQPRATAVPPRLLDELQRDLCHAITIKVIDAVYPVKVVAFKDGIAFLNRGEGAGLKEGDVLDVFTTGEELIDPDTGANLGVTESKLGQLRVTQVLPKVSKAVPHGCALASIPKEAICRLAAPAPAEPETPPARKGPKGW